MKIAYGVHGFGRGHAMRALAVLPHLTARHEVLVLAGGSAYDALWSDYPVTRIPTLKYHYNRRGKLSNFLNAKRNVSGILDVKLGGNALEMVLDALHGFKPDVVLTDSEIYTHAAARRMGIGRISFDHFGLLVHCRIELSPLDRLICRGNAFVYHRLFGEPDRCIASGFFDAPPRRTGVEVVGPVIRQEVRSVTPTRGSHLVVYFSKEHEFSPNVEQALLSLDCPVRIYGTPRRGMQDNLQFKPIANLPFIEDLASCRAVFATAGNQLCGEVLYFGKPMLAMPMECLEQRINAQQIERLGAGLQVRRRQVNAGVLRDFLANEERYAKGAAAAGTRDGEIEAVEAIERFAAELATKQRSSDRQGLQATRVGG